MRPFSAAVSASVLVLAAATAQAQDAAEVAPILTETDAENEPSVFDGDWLGIGAGLAYGTSYDGSDEYVAYPLPAIAGSLGGIGISPRSSGIALDLIELDAGNVIFSFGPVARTRSNRASQLKDPVVIAAGELDRAYEIGPQGSVTVYEVFNAYDRVSFGVDVLFDVSGAHRGMVVDPGVSYVTPLSPGVILGLSAGGQWVDSDYADYYYSVSPAQSPASGLPLFQADSGWHKAGANVALGFDLNGNLEDGGFVIGLLGGYTRMLEDAKRTPYTSLRGDADQWFAAAGLGYIF